jgi:hypothetical protein
LPGGSFRSPPAKWGSAVRVGCEIKLMDSVVVCIEPIDESEYVRLGQTNSVSWRFHALQLGGLQREQHLPEFALLRREEPRQRELNHPESLRQTVFEYLPRRRRDLRSAALVVFRVSEPSEIVLLPHGKSAENECRVLERLGFQPPLPWVANATQLGSPQLLKEPRCSLLREVRSRGELEPLRQDADDAIDAPAIVLTLQKRVRQSVAVEPHVGAKKVVVNQKMRGILDAGEVGTIAAHQATPRQSLVVFDRCRQPQVHVHVVPEYGNGMLHLWLLRIWSEDHDRGDAEGAHAYTRADRLDIADGEPAAGRNAPKGTTFTSLGPGIGAGRVIDALR